MAGRERPRTEGIGNAGWKGDPLALVVLGIEAGAVESAEKAEGGRAFRLSVRKLTSGLLAVSGRAGCHLDRRRGVDRPARADLESRQQIRHRGIDFGVPRLGAGDSQLHHVAAGLEEGRPAYEIASIVRMIEPERRAIAP